MNTRDGTGLTLVGTVVNKGEYSLQSTRVAIGSDPGNELVIDEPTVSRRHAEVMQRSGVFQIRDLGSTNGTFVNGKRVDAPVPIEAGDEIRFGGVRFYVCGESQARPGWRRTAYAPIVVALFVGLAFTSYEFTSNWMRMLDTLAVTREESARSVPTPAKANPFQSKPTENVRTPALSASTAVAPTEVSSNRPGSKPDGLQWLARINHYRRDAGQQLVSENPQLSDGDRKHACYLVKNYSMVLKSGGSLGAAGHDEALNLPWSSPEGKKAAQHSHYFAGCKPYNPDASIEWWMSAPFHRLQILNPKLLSVGYGNYVDEEGCWAACLDLKPGPGSARPDSPIQFPPDATTTSLQFVSGEWPDPLASCPGYAPPTGLPITLQLGWGATPNISKESIVSNGKLIEHCTFSGATYSNPDPFVQEWGRSTLRSFGAITLIPKEPLVSGARYTVSITTAERTYQWSFTVDRAVEENDHERQ